MQGGKLLLYLVQRAAVVAAIWGGRKAWQVYQAQKPAKKTVSSRGRPYKIMKAPAKEFKAHNPEWLVRVVKQEPRSVEEDSIIAQCPAFQELQKTIEEGWAVEFGEGAKGLFALNPEWVYLNHGSYGAELKVAGEIRRWCHEKLESEPVSFMENHALQGVAAAIAEVADLVGASWRDVVPVSNATEGINTVARGLQFRRGDIIVLSNLTYPAVRNTFARLAAQKDATIMEVTLSLKAQQDPRLIVDAFNQAIRGGYGRIRFALLDHVSSFPPVVWPVKELCQMFAKIGAKVMVDGAHCIGNIPDLDIPSLGCQFYTTNLHKWLCAAKSAALLWVHPREQPSVLPLVTSHGCNLGFRGEFLWPGTRDHSVWLSVPACVAVFKAFGQDNIARRNNQLLQEGTNLLLTAWGTSQVLGGPPHTDRTPPEDTPRGRRDKTSSSEGSRAKSSVNTPSGDASHAKNGSASVEDGASDSALGAASMAVVELPAMGPGLPASGEAARALRYELQEEHKIEVPVAFWEGKLWVRISAQIYNVLDDYQRLADAVLQIKDAPPLIESAL